MRKLLIPVVTTLLVGAAMVYQAWTPEAVVCEAPEVRLCEIAGYESDPAPVTEAERTVLPSDTQFDKRIYSDSLGRTFSVTVVIGGRTKSSVHRPELCLPGQGFQMSDPRTVLVGGTRWRRLTLMKGGTPPASFAYTFTNGTGFKTSSHLVRILTDVWDRSILGRIDRWVMLTVVSSRSDEAGFSRFLEQMEGVVK